MCESSQNRLLLRSIPGSGKNMKKNLEKTDEKRENFLENENTRN